MPPKVKITKDEIVSVTLDLLRREGEDAMNARSIASALGCSTQPVFSNFASMDELQYADLLLHVIDISNPNFENQLEAVESILRQLKLEEKPRIYVFNKVDRLETLPPIVAHLERESCIYISAATGQNLGELLALMEQKLVQNVTCVVTLPMDKAGLVNQAYASGQVTELEYTDTAVQFVWHGRQEALPHVLAPYTEIK